MAEENDLEKFVKSTLVEHAFNYLSAPTVGERTKIDEFAQKLIKDWAWNGLERQKLNHFYEDMKNPRYLRNYRIQNQ